MGKDSMNIQLNVQMYEESEKIRRDDFKIKLRTSYAWSMVKHVMSILWKVREHDNMKNIQIYAFKQWYEFWMNQKLVIENIIKYYFENILKVI